MRIIAGKYRRRKLAVNPGDITRPITDRAKETLFSHIEGMVEGKIVADICAGTGSLGLEAMSRGARGAILLEYDVVAFELLKQNVAMLGIEDQVLCWRTDVMRCSFRPKNVPHLLPMEVIFFDPPYKMAADLKPGRRLYESLLRLARPDVTSADAVMFYRIGEFDEFTMPPCWVYHSELKISSMRIVMLEKKEVSGLEDSSPDDSGLEEELASDSLEGEINEIA